MLKLDCCFITDSGKIRTNNEDNFFICGTYKRTRRNFDTEKKILFIEVEFLLSVMVWVAKNSAKKRRLYQ